MKKYLLPLALVAALFFIGCEDGSGSNDDGGGSTPTTTSLVMTESDYTSGWYGSIKGGTYSKGVSIDSDARIVVSASGTYILERSSANIMKIDNGTVVYQQKLADNYNPQAMAVSGTTGYVVGLGSPWVYVIDLTSGDKVDSVDLSAFNNNNTHPSAKDIVMVNSSIYVGMQRFEAGSWTPSAASQIAVISPITTTIDDTITCEGYNLSQFAVDGEDFYVLNSGDSYGAKDHGTFEKVNTADNSIATLGTNLLDGAPITNFAQKDDNEFYVAAYKGRDDMPVSLIDVTTGSEIIKVPDVVYAFGGLVYDDDNGMLYIGEHSADFGISMYDEDADSISTIATTLKPTSFAVK